MQPIIYTSSPLSALSGLLNQYTDVDRIVWLTDQTTHHHCLPLFRAPAPAFAEIVIDSGDSAKNINSLTTVWKGLQEAQTTRHSLLLLLGGGMVTDLGGFAAATFKRGIRFINIPTTLLGMVDAAVGGKTGINFGGLKNEIGTFAEADTVMICTEFLRTLDEKNLRSGYAEMLKHSLLSDREMLKSHLHFDLDTPDYALLLDLVHQSIDFKQKIVEQDPHEQGLRKALNLGHTAGHAIESLMLSRQTPVLHGYAVAWGLVCELFISTVQTGFPPERLQQITRYILAHYGRPAITCDDYACLHELMLHDKKNVGTSINFTLLSNIGEIHINQTAEESTINDAFDYLREA